MISSWYLAWRTQYCLWNFDIAFVFFLQHESQFFSYTAKIIVMCCRCNIRRPVSSPVCAFSSSSNDCVHPHNHQKASSYSLSNNVLVLAVRMVLDGGLNNLFVLTSLLGTAWFTGLSCYCSCLILWRRQVVSSLVVRQKSFFSFCKLFFFIFHQPLESEKISSDFAFLLKFCCFWNCLCFS